MKHIKPTTPGQRGMISTDYGVLTKKKPEKSLIKYHHRKRGRSKGKITTRHRGGGSKKRYREIDFKQNDLGSNFKIISLEYDPYRTSFIALIQNQYGIKSYILAYEGAHVGDEIHVSDKTLVKHGNRMYLKNIPIGTFVHNIEIKPDKGGQLARSAGSYARVLAHDAGYTQLAMPSSEIRVVLSRGLASIGTVSNSSHREQVVGKAGKNRRRGKRPHVRGSAMNAVAHPHGGGEGKAPIGLRGGPKTPWGKKAYGVKTRRRKKYSNKHIIKRRKTKR